MKAVPACRYSREILRKRGFLMLYLAYEYLGIMKKVEGTMTFQQLLFVLEVANCDSISKAAKNLYTHQSNVSTAIKSLEDEFGIKIFNRSKKGITLTSEGEEFLTYAQEIIQQKHFLEDRYAARREGHQNGLRVSSMRAFFLIEFIRKFQNNILSEDEDGYYFRLIKAPFERILEDISSNKIEIGIVFIQASKKNMIAKLSSVKGLNYYELGESQLNIIVRAGHPVLENFSVDKLIEYPYIISEEDELYDRFFDEPFDAVTKLFKTKPKHIISTNDSSVNETIVGETNAFHISSVPHQHAKRQNCVSIEIPGNEAKLLFYYVVRKDYHPSPLAESFIEELKAMFLEMNRIPPENPVL